MPHRYVDIRNKKEAICIIVFQLVNTWRRTPLVGDTSSTKLNCKNSCTSCTVVIWFGLEGLKQLNYSNIDDPKYNDIRNDKDLHTLLDATLKTFGSWSAKALSEWSHKEGSPWAIAFLGNNLEYGGTINDEAIKTYFTSIMNLPAHE